MSIFNIPFQSITINEIQSLINNVSENRNLDYKEVLPANNDKGKREFCRNVISFATTNGGDIIFGIKENDDAIASEIVPIQSQCIDDVINQLENIVYSGIEPKLRVQTKPLGYNGGYLIIFRVPKCHWGPPMLKYKELFFTRGSRSKLPLNYMDIKNQFIDSTKALETFNKFRFSRIDNILKVFGPDSGTSVLLFNLFPIENISFDHNKSDLLDIRNKFNDLPINNYTEYNFEGIKIGRNNDYFQIYHDAKFELCLAKLTFNDNGTEFLYLESIESFIIRYVKRIFSVLKSENLFTPFFAGITILNLNNTISRISDYVLQNSKSVTRDKLIFPEIFIDDYDLGPEIYFKQSFDILWRTFNYKQSASYNDIGVFKKDI